MSPILTVLSLDRAEIHVPESPAICISINETDGLEAVIPVQHYLAVLRLEFDDLEEGEPAFSRRHITPGQAETILSFARHYDTAREVVIHCQGGMSRSPAVALALAEALWPDRVDVIRTRFKAPNQRVLAALRSAAAPQTQPTGFLDRLTHWLHS